MSLVIDSQNVPLERWATEPRTTFQDMLSFIFKKKHLILHDQNFKYTINGRAALYRLFLNIPPERGSTILMPAFHCPTIVEPAMAAGYQIKFYDVDLSLLKAVKDIEGLIDESIAAVLIINYFGFQFDLGALISTRLKDYLVIEDCSHSFFNPRSMSLTEMRGDACVYSFWKQLPSIVGGGVRADKNLLWRSEVNYTSLKNSICTTKDLTKIAIKTLINDVLPLVPIFGAFNDKKDLLSGPVTNRSIERSYPFNKDECFLNIPWFAKAIISHSDLSSIARRRRKNFKLYLELLSDVGGYRRVFTCLPSEVCPWAFPIFLDDRYNNDWVLRNKGLLFFTFGELLHPITNQISTSIPSALMLRDGILCLPVHQDLSEEAIRINCDILMTHFAK